MLNPSRQWLIRLLKSGSMPESSIPKAAKPDITNVREAGLIRWERQGGGARYSVSDEEALRKLLISTGYDGDVDGLTPKARAVALHGDAHRGRDDAMLLTLSATGQPLWRDGLNTLDVSDQVSRFGVSSLVVRPGDQWRTDRPVGLVENLDLVLYGQRYFSQIGFDGSVIYYSGWLSKAFIAWLTEMSRAPSYVLFPDYDLVGIKNYVLAKRVLGDSLSIHVPDNLPELLRRFGNADRLASKAGRALIESSNDPVAKRLYQMLLDAGAGLDQESLLLDLGSPPGSLAPHSSSE